MRDFSTGIPDLLHDGIEVLIYAGDEDSLGVIRILKVSLAFYKITTEEHEKHMLLRNLVKFTL